MCFSQIFGSKKPHQTQPTSPQSEAPRRPSGHLASSPESWGARHGAAEGFWMEVSSWPFKGIDEILLYTYIYIINTLPETNSLHPWKKVIPKGKDPLPTIHLSGAMLVSGRVYSLIAWWFVWTSVGSGNQLCCNIFCVKGASFNTKVGYPSRTW